MAHDRVEETAKYLSNEEIKQFNNNHLLHFE